MPADASGNKDKREPTVAVFLRECHISELGHCLVHFRLTLRLQHNAKRISRIIMPQKKLFYLRLRKLYSFIKQYITIQYVQTITGFLHFILPLHFLPSFILFSCLALYIEYRSKTDFNG
jgi:hypothetical protein